MGFLIEISRVLLHLGLRSCVAELPFVHHLHEFDAHNDTARIVKLLEAEHRLHPGFNAAMVLLYDIVQVLTTANLYRVLPPVVELIAHAHAPQSRMRRLETIQCDGTRLAVVLQCFAKKSLRRSAISSSTEMRFHGPSSFIHSTVQVHPLTSNLYIGLITAPGSTNWLLV